MKIAVLGGNGFVGSNLVKYLAKSHTVKAVTRNNCDLFDSISVKRFLTLEKFDVIVNAAATYTDASLLTDTKNNLGLFMNFYENASKFGKFVNLGSGAEFDRQYNINCAEEKEIFDRLPMDSYGFGQNIKARLCYDKKDFYTIRIFNCFGLGEISSRIFPKFLAADKSLEINNDRYFDYFSIQDLCKVVDNCVMHDWTVKDVNAVYEEKLKISEALSLFCDVNNINKNFYVNSTSSNNYTGNSKKLSNLNIKLDGLIKGFKQYFN